MSQNFSLLNDTYELLFWFSGELDNISSTTFVRDLYIQTKYDRRSSGLLGPCSVKVDGTFSHCCYDSKHFLSQSMVTIATGLVVINVGQEHVLCLNLIFRHLQDLTKVNIFVLLLYQSSYVILIVCLCLYMHVHMLKGSRKNFYTLYTPGYPCIYKVCYETKRVLDPKRLFHCGETNCTGYDPNILISTRKSCVIDANR